MSLLKQGWHVVYTRPKQERKAFEGILNRKLDCYLPTQLALKTWSDRKKYVETPLFPSYVFVYISSLHDFYDAGNVDGVLNFVRIGKTFASIPDRVINDLKALTSSLVDFEVSSAKFAAGQKLYIKSGPLSGHECEFVNVNGKQSAIVRIDFLNRNVLVLVPVEFLLISA